MRVLQFYKAAYPDSVGGVEQAINQIASGASRLGVHTDVLTLASGHDTSTIEIDGHHVHRARKDIEIASTGFSISAFWRFTELAKKADLIHYHFPWPFMDVVHFATRIKKPTLVTYHSDVIRQKNLLRLYRPLKRRFLDSVDHIVATSPNYAASSEVLRRYAAKVSTIPIGLDKNSYAAPQAERLQYWRETIGPSFFLFVGVLRYYKGLHILLEAAQGTDYPIVIVGGGPLEAELKAQALKLGLRNVHFLGKVPEADKTALLALCCALVFPSHQRSEAFGISLLEAAMFGKPMISCEIGTGTTFINIDGETGLAIPPNDTQALHVAMDYLWQHPEVAAAMGKRAEQRYWEVFTAERMVRSYVDLYQTLIDRYKQRV